MQCCACILSNSKRAGPAPFQLAQRTLGNITLFLLFPAFHLTFFLILVSNFRAKGLSIGRKELLTPGGRLQPWGFWKHQACPEMAHLRYP